MKKEKILIIGSKGMAGHVIYKYFIENNRYDVIDISRNNDVFESKYTMNIFDINQLSEIFNHERPDYVVNCVGILNKDAEMSPSKAIFCNSYLPHFIAEEGRRLDFKLIHISTDCVFSGKRGKYLENECQDGVGMYARSKALGEVIDERNLTIRTSIIGPELKKDGIGLFHWIMNQKGAINGYKNVIWTGITTFQLAKVIEHSINENLVGLYHAVNNESISKYDLLLIIMDVFNKHDITILPDEKYCSNKSLINTRGDLGIGSYQEMINEMKEWMIKHEHMYIKYIS